MERVVGSYSYDYQDFQKASKSEKFQIFTSAMVKAKYDKLALNFIYRLVYNTGRNVVIIEPILMNEDYQKVLELVFQNQLNNHTHSHEISILMPFIEEANKFIVGNKRFDLSPHLVIFVLLLLRKTFTTREGFWNRLIPIFFDSINKHYFSDKEHDKAIEVGVEMVTYLMSRPEVNSIMICQLLKNQFHLNIHMRLTLYRFISKDDLSNAFGSITVVTHAPEFRTKLGNSPLVPEDRAGAIKQYFSRPEGGEDEVFEAIQVHLGIKDVVKIVHDYTDKEYCYGERIYNDLKLFEVWNNEDFAEFDREYYYS